jgi:hypothetical protein
MLFINDEGTVDGGLIYRGASVDGKPSSRFQLFARSRRAGVIP